MAKNNDRRDSRRDAKGVESEIKEKLVTLNRVAKLPRVVVLLASQQLLWLVMVMVRSDMDWVKPVTSLKQYPKLPTTLRKT